MKPYRSLPFTLLCLLLLWAVSCKDKTPEPVKSAEKTITTFAFNGLSPTVSAAIDGAAITATVPVGTNLSALVPTITLSAAATVSPASGVAQNFSSPVTYTVTAEDGTTSTYTVTVSIQGVSITSFAPATGGAGTLVVINGLGFSGVSTDNKVSINGADATITASSPTQITVQIPERAGSGNIVVAVGGKQATSASGFGYQYQVASNTTLVTASGRLFQSVAVDPDDGTVYASDRTNSVVFILKPDGQLRSVILQDNFGTKHTSLTGISILKTGVGGAGDKVLLVTNEVKGVFYYSLGDFTPGTVRLSGNTFQPADAIYNAPTSVVPVSQGATATYFLNGTYYLACFGNSTIVRTTRLNGVTQSPVIIGSPGTRGFNAGSVPTVNAKFDNVVGLAYKNDLLYVADEGNHAIRVIDYNAGTVSTLVGNGTPGNATGAFSATRLNTPCNIAVDNSGLIYITDRANGRIVLLDPRSQTSQTLISGLNAPYGLTVDKNGAVYVGEWSLQGSNRILKLTVK